MGNHRKDDVGHVAGQSVEQTMSIDCTAGGWLTKRESDAPASRCADAEAAVLLHFLLSGSAAVLGRFFVRMSHCSRDYEAPSPQADGTVLVGRCDDGIITLITGSGSVLAGEYGSGEMTCPIEGDANRHFLLDLRITPDGTGPFSVASGSGTLQGSLNVDTGETTVRLRAVIRIDSKL